MTKLVKTRTGKIYSLTKTSEEVSVCFNKWHFDRMAWKDEEEGNIWVQRYGQFFQVFKDKGNTYFLTPESDHGFELKKV